METGDDVSKSSHSAVGKVKGQSRRGSVVKKLTAKARVNRRTSNFSLPTAAIEEGNEDHSGDEDLSYAERLIEMQTKQNTGGAVVHEDSVELVVEYWFERYCEHCR